MSLRKVIKSSVPNLRKRTEIQLKERQGRLIQADRHIENNYSLQKLSTDEYIKKKRTVIHEQYKTVKVISEKVIDKKEKKELREISSELKKESELWF